VTETNDKSILGLHENFIGINLEKKENIFSSDFLKKYNLEKFYIQKNHGFKLHSKIRTFDEIKSPPFENEWGWYAAGIEGGLPSNWILYCNEIDCLLDLKRIFYKIDFKENLKLIIKEVECQILLLKEEFIALHIRGADIIYGDYYKKWSLEDFVGDKVFPYEIALEIIKNHANSNNKIIIFGQDVKSNMKLLNYIVKNNILPKNKIFTVDEFVNKSLNIFERTFFEMVLMSYALKIYTPGIQAQKSAFSQCAMMIAGRKNVISYHEIFSLEQQYRIIKENLKLLHLDNLYDSMTYFQLYKLSRTLNLSLELSLEYITKAMELDSDNYAWCIHYIYCHFLINDFSSIEYFLKTLLKQNRLDSLLQTFTISGAMRIYQQQEKYFIFFGFKDAYPTISYVGMWLNYHYGEFVTAYKIYRNYQKNSINLEIDLKSFFSYHRKINLISNNAALIVKNHLSYKLGKILLECKSFGDLIELPMIVRYFIKESKKEKIYLESSFFELEKLDCYEQSCNIKKYFSYQLGNIIIKSFKNWYKGDLLLLPYKIFILYKNLKKK
ncbi:hypothetical protein CINS5995_07910, partial [Campylobacter insulaenigrae]|nr:hypothetical protein [Campylobacter insulaenigrae]MCR6580831.1 hypothetical protein [Campylobacter insulaenigrae]MCR6586968.1 hypothetical protein [Campylobacter insulaenigrae]